MKQRPMLRNNENGFASLVVALLLIMILALLTVAFAQLARREQQHALNKQLSTQAYYAAESGVNDAYKTLKNWIDTSSTPSINPNTCLSPAVIGVTNIINDTNDISYSCVLMNLDPNTLNWQGVASDSNRYTTFSTTGAMNSLSIYWSSADGNNTIVPAASNTDFMTSSVWNTGKYPPLLELSLTPLDDSGGTFTRDSLLGSTFTAYLYPAKDTSGNSGQVSFAAGGSPIVKAVDCPVSSDGVTRQCSVIINGIPHQRGANEHYLIRILNHYDTANIIVGNATTGNGGSGLQLGFVGGQATIDVTGKARNVLKRLHVTVPLTTAPDLPPIEAQDICKRLATAPTDPQSNPAGTSFIASDEAPASAGHEPACILSP